MPVTPAPCSSTTGATSFFGSSAWHAAPTVPAAAVSPHRYTALPAITGKLELEYEGELKGGDTVARELIRTAVGKIYNEFFEGVNFSQVINWFDIGGSLKLDEGVDSATMVRQLDAIQGLMEKTKALGLTENEPDSVRAAAAEFILEGLYAHRRISRNEERGFHSDRPKQPEPREQQPRPPRRQFN